MKKTWIYQRPGHKGYWVGWYENGNKKSKALPNKRLAEHFSHIKYQQLNSDVFISSIDIPWSEIKKGFLERYDLEGLADNSKKVAERFLGRFENICKPRSSKSINLDMVEQYLLKRQKPDKDGKKFTNHTINKDIEIINTFVEWMKKKKFHPGDIKIKRLKTKGSTKKALTTDKIRALLGASETLAWTVRILLSLITGLRKTDIESLEKDWIDLQGSQIDTRSQKTGKVYIARPLPRAAMSVLTRHIATLPDDQVMLFTDTNVRKEWEYLRNRAKGCSSVTRQDLRVTFSTYMQKVGSIGSAQNLLEHSDKRVTENFYSDQELILRWKVNQLPVEEWLKTKGASPSIDGPATWG